MEKRVLLLAGAITVPVVTVAAPRLGLPPLAPADQQQLQLGKALFFSTRASADGTVSCATCHDPQKAFSDGNAVSTGIQGLKGTRNSPSLKNAAFSEPLMWDGRRATLEDQVLHPLTTAREHGLNSVDEALTRLKADPRVMEFANGKPLTETRVREALATFVRSTATGNSAFDRFMFAGQSNALTPQQRQGLTLFKQVGCSYCHTMGEQAATFTDGLFHVSNQVTALSDTDLKKRLAEADQLQPAQLDSVITQRPELAVLGRYLVTHQTRDIGAMKTPSLREVAQTAPYFHDGSTQTLDAAVRQELSYRSQQSGYPIILDDREIQDIVKFLQALDSP